MNPVAAALERLGESLDESFDAVTRSPACPVFVPHVRRVRTSNLTQLALLGVVEPWAVRRLPVTAAHCTRDPQDCARAAVRWLRQRFRCTRSLCVVTAPRLVRPHADFLTTCGVVLLRRIESTVTSQPSYWATTSPTRCALATNSTASVSSPTVGAGRHRLQGLLGDA